MHEKKLIEPKQEEQALQVSNMKSKHDKKDTKGYKDSQKNTNDKRREKDRRKHFHTNHKGGTRSKAHIEFYKCHKFVYYRSECKTNMSKKRDESSNFVEQEEEEISVIGNGGDYQKPVVLRHEMQQSNDLCEGSFPNLR